MHPLGLRGLFYDEIYLYLYLLYKISKSHRRKMPLKKIMLRFHKREHFFAVRHSSFL
jgi:hypothetical protein